MKWIKTSDKLPTLYKSVLIYGNGINNAMDIGWLFNNDGKIEWTTEEYFIPTHWMLLPEIPNQPERSKREDLDCEKCKDIKKGIEWECPSRFIDYLDQSKMRCSEHCGNTVREAQ